MLDFHVERRQVGDGVGKIAKCIIYSFFMDFWDLNRRGTVCLGAASRSFWSAGPACARGGDNSCLRGVKAASRGEGPRHDSRTQRSNSLLTRSSPVERTASRGRPLLSANVNVRSPASSYTLPRLRSQSFAASGFCYWLCLCQFSLHWVTVWIFLNCVVIPADKNSRQWTVYFSSQWRWPIVLGCIST